MKKILTMLAFLFTMGSNINAETTMIPDEVKVEVPADITITENEGKTFKIVIESEDSIITKLTKVVSENGTYVIKLDRPIEQNEIKSFNEAGIKITIVTPKPIKLTSGKNIEIKKSANH